MERVIQIKWAAFQFCVFISLMCAKVTCGYNILETTVITETNEEISLRWVETEPLLANKNLPVWVTGDHRYVYNDFDVLKQLGEFRTYHDLEKSSAVVLFEEWNCIFGTIDVRYTIVCLPLDELNGRPLEIKEHPNFIVADHQVHFNREKSVESSKVSSTSNVATASHESPTDFKMLIRTFVNPDEPIRYDSKYEVNHMAHKSTTQRDGPPQKLQRLNTVENYEQKVITVYPEILILISHEAHSNTRYYSTLALRYIVQLNSVAMLFAKLESHGIKIHINLAGLVIEDVPDTFFSVSSSDSGLPSGSSILDSATDYIRKVRLRRSGCRKAFTDDSFDMFLLATKNERQECNANSGGFSTTVYDMKSMRLKVKNRKLLGSLIDVTNPVDIYVNAAREIAHLMSVEDDPLEYLDLNDDKQCQSIMHPGNRYRLNCLQWSKRSVMSFKKYLSENTNRCFMRNFPRSLHPYDRPIKTLIPADQCLCYGYYPFYETTRLERDRFSQNCKRSLRCAKSMGSPYVISVPSPVDGTPCDERDDTQVCWRSACVSMVPSTLS